MGWKRRRFGTLLPNLIISAGPDAVKSYFRRGRSAQGGEAPAGPAQKLATKYKGNSLKMIDKRWSSRYDVSRYP